MATQLHIRFMIRADHYQVQHIEETCFEFPWSMTDFLKCMRQRNVIGMVIENQHGRIMGYMLYELQMRSLRVLNFAVYPAFQRQGVGSAMIEKLRSKLSGDRRTCMTLEVRETNLPAQLFFKSQGFRAVSVLKNSYDDSAEDAYLMQYRHQSLVPAVMGSDAAAGAESGNRLTAMRFER